MTRAAPSFHSFVLPESRASVRMTDEFLVSSKRALSHDYPRATLFLNADEFPGQLSSVGRRSLMAHARHIEYLYFHTGSGARAFLTAYFSETLSVREIMNRFYAARHADVFVADDLYDATLAALSLCRTVDFWDAQPRPALAH